MKYKLLAMAAAAVTAGFLSLGSAQAANVMSGASTLPIIPASQTSNVLLAGHHHNGMHRWRWRRHHNGFGGSGLWLGFGVPLYGGGYGGYPYYAYDDDYDDDYIAPRGSRHVRYCLNRYLTYNIRTNTFRGYDGYLHQCRSPYRY